MTLIINLNDCDVKCTYKGSVEKVNVPANRVCWDLEKTVNNIPMRMLKELD